MMSSHLLRPLRQVFVRNDEEDNSSDNDSRTDRDRDRSVGEATDTDTDTDSDSNSDEPDFEATSDITVCAAASTRLSDRELNRWYASTSIARWTSKLSCVYSYIERFSAGILA